MRGRTLIVEHDCVHDEWRCDLHDVAHTVIVAKTLQKMEDDLDWLEATGRLDTEVRSDVVLEQKETADHCDRRRCRQS
jgi:hypothetical protein